MRSLLLTVALPLLIHAQSPTQAGSASISGKVVLAGANTPFRDVQLTLTSTSSQPNRTVYNATNNDDGTFAFSSIVPGAYNLVANSGFSRFAFYGSPGPGRPGTPITVAEGQNLRDIVIVMPRQTVITGRVVNDLGDPIQGAYVAALRYLYVAGRKTLTRAGNQATTDDQGNYRLAGVIPGTYYLYAAPPEMLRAGKPSWFTGDPRTQFRYAPVFFPAAGGIESAVQIQLDQDAELHGLDFKLARQQAYTLNVTVPNAAAAPKLLLSLRPIKLLNLPGTYNTGGLASNGRAQFAGVLPGVYHLMVSAPDSERTFTGRMDLNISGDTDVSLPLTPTREISGRVVMDGGASLPSSPIGVWLTTLDGSSMGTTNYTFATHVIEHVNPDVSFHLKGLGADIVRLSVMPFPDGYYIKSATLGNADAWFNDIDLSQASGDLTITLAPKTASLQGKVNASDGTRLGSATAVLIPSESNRLGKPKFYRTGFTNAQGDFLIRNIPPGQYKLFAWEEVVTDFWLDPDFVRPFDSFGVEVTLEPSGNQQTAVRAIPKMAH